jgi:bifunctional DNA-binding transcriptional regulator/antitoxin component of YhaV-PrlF toxin-antitoxin module
MTVREQHRARLGAGSRLVVPATIRKALALEIGDEVLLRVEEGELRVINPRQALERARRLIRDHVRTTEDLTAGLLRERRAAAERE